MVSLAETWKKLVYLKQGFTAMDCLTCFSRGHTISSGNQIWDKGGSSVRREPEAQAYPLREEESIYYHMDQCKFKEGCSRKFKVNASTILSYLHISQTLRSEEDHRDNRRTNAALTICKMIFDGMWLSVFNYINFHDFSFTYIYLHMYKYK